MIDANDGPAEKKKEECDLVHDIAYDFTYIYLHAKAPKDNNIFIRIETSWRQRVGLTVAAPKVMEETEINEKFSFVE